MVGSLGHRQRTVQVSGVLVDDGACPLIVGGLHHQRCLGAAEAGVELSSRLPEEWLHVQARGHCASRRIRLRGWTDEDFADCIAARDAAKQAGDSGFYGWHAMSCAFFYSYRAEGREACRGADEGTQIGIETDDAFLYMSCHYFESLGAAAPGRVGQGLETDARRPPAVARGRLI